MYTFSLSLLTLSQGKLELITGATASLAQLQVFDADGRPICELDNDQATLGSYPVQNGFRIHVRILMLYLSL